MTPEQFCYWLQGRLELQPDNPISKEECIIIKDHLNLVFDKLTSNQSTVNIPEQYINPNYLEYPDSTSTSPFFC